ncbi:hypothetical protein LXL04_019050 [Taraxacum kok-saghyz]
MTEALTISGEAEAKQWGRVTNCDFVIKLRLTIKVEYCNIPGPHVSQYCPFWATRHENFSGDHPSWNYTRPSTLNCRVPMGSAALTAL